MAGYARKGEFARLIHSHAVQLNQMHIQRPRNANIQVYNFVLEGVIDLTRFFSPALLTIDPLENGQVVEYKRIIAVAGWMESGEVTLYWAHNSGTFHEDHVINGGFNYVELEDPFVISNGLLKGEYIRPNVQEEPEFPGNNLTAMAIIEVSPI